ncbi:MAG: LAGLIDADG endonuclease [Parcubacteria group bacterium]
MVIPRKARRITYSTEIRELKKRLKLDESQKAIVIGSILGDATLELNWSKTNCRMRIDHSIKQEDYVRLKYTILKDWVLTEPKYYKPHRSIWFRTISHPNLTELWKIFYKNKKKIIPENIAELIQNPLTVATWFMDDGNVRRRNSRIISYDLNTQSFTYAENEKLLNALKTVYGISCSLHKNHNRHRIYIGTNEKNKFQKIIRKLSTPSLKYKLQ